MDGDIERRIAAGHRRFLLPWLGTVLAVIVLAALGYGLAAGNAASGAPLPALPKMMTAAGFVWCGLVLFIRQQVLAPLGMAARLPAPDPEALMRHLFAGHLVLWSAAVVPAIVGIAQILAGGDARLHLLLCAASIMVLGYLLPARSKLTELAKTTLEIWNRAQQAKDLSGNR
jgi:hypothetical protein